MLRPSVQTSFGTQLPGCRAVENVQERRFESGPGLKDHFVVLIPQACHVREVKYDVELRGVISSTVHAHPLVPCEAILDIVVVFATAHSGVSLAKRAGAKDSRRW